MSAATTQKYLSVARIDGVGESASSGSSAGRAWSPSSRPLAAAKYQASAPMPASRSTKLTTDETTTSPPGWLSMRLSDGQLLVYVISAPGRFVEHAQLVQKKNAPRSSSRSGVLTA